MARPDISAMSLEHLLDGNVPVAYGHAGACTRGRIAGYECGCGHDALSAAVAKLGEAQP